MEVYWLCFTLLTDATFGRGEGIAGMVDQEVEHDRYGLPYLRGRTLKGLLNEECSTIMFALGQQGRALDRWQASAQRLFGGPGSTRNDDAALRVGAAQLPADVRDAVQQSIERGDAPLQPTDILQSLTTIRRQTAVDEQTGAPYEGTLRAMRVILRQTPFEARLTFLDRADGLDLPLLVACVMGLRRAGTGRNRGRGRLRATLHADQEGQPGPDLTRAQFDRFAAEIRR